MTVVATGNLLLDRLEPSIGAALAPEEIEFELGHRLYRADEDPRFVFFPIRGSIISIVRATSDGQAVEAGLSGDEGVTSIDAILARDRSSGTEGVLQHGSAVVRVTTRRARESFERDTRLREGVLACTNDLLTQLTQNAVCNRLHRVEARLAKWLLLIRARAGTDELKLTHEFIAQMLGIHRPGVSLAVETLEQDGLIEHSRNRIAIRQPAELEARSCECAGVANGSLATLRQTLTA